MLRAAVNEIRLFPGRFVATILAVAISVGFLVAIATVAATERQNVANGTNLALAKADVVVTGYSDDHGQVLQKIKSVAGVKAAESSFSTSMLLTNGDRSAFTTVVNVPGEDFRWAELTEGRWAEDMNELTLSTDALSALDVKVGDKITPAPGVELTVVGATRDAKPLYTVAGYTKLDDEAARSANTWVVKTDGRSPETVASDVSKALSGMNLQVETGDAARIKALNDLTLGFDVFRNILYAFGAVALVVGMIIIANTFTILVTQRRRQIALLRAVGAGPGQVRGRLLWEALLLGLVGSLLGVLLGLGVAWVAGQYTGANFWGIVVDWGQVAFAVGVGVLATLVSMLGPSLAATQVKPLEALQTVPPAAKAKRIGMVRTAFCVIFAVIGILLFFLSRSDARLSLMWAILCGACLTFAILGAAPLYVAPILRVLGKVFGFGGPTVRLAAENAARNPRRAAATAVALMLAVGLVVTLQVAVATVRTSAMSAIDQQFPVDLTVTSQEPLSDAVKQQLAQLNGVKERVEVKSKTVEVDSLPLEITNANEAYEKFGVAANRKVPDGVARVAQYSSVDNSLDLPGVGALKVEQDPGIDGYRTVHVSQSTFDKVKGDEAIRAVWFKVNDRTDMSLFNNVSKLAEQNKDLQIGGGALVAGVLTQVINVILLVLTALLGVAVLIALVGVGNTLGLSVLERQRESALLRALGMQRGSLRLMLLTEALMLALVGTVIGVAAGTFFGWLAVSSAFRMIPGGQLTLEFGIDWPLTIGLVGVCVLAACLASVLPGRRAANATPTEALAAE